MKEYIVTLANFFAYGSDIKDIWLEFRHVKEEEVLDKLKQCWNDPHWNNIEWRNTSIIIDPDIYK